MLMRPGGSESPQPRNYQVWLLRTNHKMRSTNSEEALLLLRLLPIFRRSRSCRQYIKPFLTEPGANSVAVPEAKLLIVTDYATNLIKIARWIEAIDKPRPGVVVETLAVKHVEAGKLAAQLQALLAAQARAQGGQAQGGVEVSHDERTNQLFFIGDPPHVDAAKQLIEFLDVPLDLTTRTYSFHNISAEQIDKLAQELIDPVDRKRLYRSAVDSHSNLLIVTATTEIHQQIEDLRSKMDIDHPGTQAPFATTKSRISPLANCCRRFVRLSSKPVDVAMAAWTGNICLRTGAFGPPARNHPDPAALISCHQPLDSSPRLRRPIMRRPQHRALR